jgi:hypothetical protein
LSRFHFRSPKTSHLPKLGPPHTGTCGLKFALSRNIAPLILVALLSAGCEIYDDSLIDTVGNPPLLLTASVTPSAINSDTINIGPVRNPDDVLSISGSLQAKASLTTDRLISQVRYVIRAPGETSARSEGILQDDGAGIDQIKADGVFSAKASFQIHRVEVGIFRVSLTAIGQNGSESNTLILPITVFRGNSAPGISLQEAPDTVQLQDQPQALTLRVRAWDPDGLGDIARVYFNSFGPEGTPSRENPLYMYDDGEALHGDERSGDGVYSLIVKLPPTAPVGTHRFEFRAYDRSNETSNIVVHLITVKP